MYSCIQISKLNDFIFCPYSVYLHSIYDNFNSKGYHDTYQTVGKITHESIDERKYTTSKFILQGLEIYSEKYNLVGKIDTFDYKKGILVERKYKVKKIFDGYKFQLYAQMFSLEEMGYRIEKLFIHSLSDNKRYEIPMPNREEILKFEKLIDDIKNYKPKLKKINNKKCERCIYKPLCH
ncbi:MAG: type V CRISPR-associated protein Cas4 [Minisyncoccales bacterium]|jgi:CRISPR-associated exonuclease Cas4|nr:type V CRISPR-associated protein Cas4 [Candidatus Paceibacterota bacterium]